MFNLNRCLQECLDLGPFALDTAIETTIRGSFWSLTFLEDEGGGVEVQEKCPRDVSLDIIDKRVFPKYQNIFWLC